MSQERIVVGIVGPKQSGKSEIYKQLAITRGFVRHRFAGPLKAMMKAGFGLTDEELDGNLKEVPCTKLGGRTPRWAQQSLGTEWGRELIHNDIWIMAWEATMPQVLDDEGKLCGIVADDVRFPNEVEAIRRHGGKLIAIQRPSLGLVRTDTHASEAHAHTLEVDFRIVNGGSLEDLRQKIDEILSRLSPVEGTEPQPDQVAS